MARGDATTRCTVWILQVPVPGAQAPDQARSWQCAEQSPVDQPVAADGDLAHDDAIPSRCRPPAAKRWSGRRGQRLDALRGGSEVSQGLRDGVSLWLTIATIVSGVSEAEAPGSTQRSPAHPSRRLPSPHADHKLRTPNRFNAAPDFLIWRPAPTTCRPDHDLANHAAPSQTHQGVAGPPAILSRTCRSTSRPLAAIA